MLKDLVLKCRSYRRFYGDVELSMDTLKELADLARVTGSAANLQTLRYRLVNDPQERSKVYDTLGWAGALQDWDGPDEDERPTAYIIMLNDQTIAKNRGNDVGISAQTILLGAVEQGYGGCMLGNVRRNDLAAALGIDQEKYTIELVLALGKPNEDIRLVEVGADGSTTYYRDENQVHYVPKRALEDILV